MVMFMRRCQQLLSALLLSVVALTASADQYQAAVDRFRKAGAEAMIDGAYGYAIFPTIGKGGIFIGGAYGEGRVFNSSGMVGEVAMTQVTVGFQLGGQTYSQLVLFRDENAFKEFTSGNFEFGAQATAIALTAAAGVEASTGGGAGTSVSGNQNNAKVEHGGYRKGMAVFTIAKGGLMYEASIGGQKFDYTPY